MGKITKGEFAHYVGDFLALNGALTSASPDTNEKILRVIEMSAAEIEGNGVRFAWIEAEDPMYPDASQEVDTPIGYFQPLVKYVAIHVAPMLGLIVTPQMQMVSRSAYQSLIKFDWEGSTPKMRLRGGSPLGSGNTKYRYRRRYMPNVENLDVENNGQLGDLTE